MPSLSGSRPVVALVAIGLLLGFALGAAVSRPRLVASQPTTSPAVSAVALATAPPTARPTSRPSVRPSPTIRPACELPDQLPLPMQPIAAPQVDNGNAAMVFASPLYRRDDGGNLVARDETDVDGADWAVGLWYVVAGTDEARLVLAPDGGMVLPLAIAQDGTLSAVWWLPQRRDADQDACVSGIYVVSNATGTTRLIATGDWTAPQGDTAVDDAPGSTFWSDPWTHRGTPRDYRLPAVAFSSDSQHLALIDHDHITLYGLNDDVAVAPEHAGACTDWAWSPTGATFVAGCERMTSAWIVDAAGGYGTRTVALPTPAYESNPGWQVPSGATIGVTSGAEVRVVRFYGFATGCEVQGCTLPSPAWSSTTIDLVTGESTSKVVKAKFLIDIDDSYWDSRLSANASWVYARTLDGNAVAIDIGTANALPAPRAGLLAGISVQGERLFDVRRGSGGTMVVRSFGRSGLARFEASISRPELALLHRRAGLFVAGLAAVLPPR